MRRNAAARDRERAQRRNRRRRNRRNQVYQAVTPERYRIARRRVDEMMDAIFGPLVLEE